MNQFADRAHVRLRSRDFGTYLHADEDGWGVSQSPHRASLNTAWTVHRLERIGVTYVLFHGAAYGRYLALLPEPAPPGHPVVRRPAQSVYDTPIQGNLMWNVHPAADGSDDVDLRHVEHGAFLMPRFVVEPIPARLLPPDFPVETPNGIQHPLVLQRTIRYVQANLSGIFILPWRTFQFHGRFVVDLVRYLMVILHVNFNDIALCVRAGFYGRLTPLVINLPISEEPMDVIVYHTNSAAALELQHPDMDAL
ncbi:unnamed protein product [Urochloa humidicola]